MERLRVGLIGCGSIAQAVHLKILSRLRNVELIAIAEPDSIRRIQAQARAPKTAAFPDYHELLAMPELQAVVICLPSALHAEAAKAATVRRKHVYLEKPMATSLTEAQGLMDAWRNAQTLGMIGFNYRFHPLLQAVKAHIESGKLGKLLTIRSTFTSHSPEISDWKRSRVTGGGALLEHGSHHIDLIPFVTGEKILKVFSEIRTDRSEADTVTLHLHLSGGVIVQSVFSMNAVQEDRMEIYGQSGKIAVDRYLSFHPKHTGSELNFSPARRLFAAVKSVMPDRYMIRKLLQPRNEPSYQLALQHFVEGAIRNRPVKPDFDDGYRCLEIIEAAEKSARTGQMVSVEAKSAGDFVVDGSYNAAANEPNKKSVD